MTQEQVIVLAFKAAEIASVVTIAVFVGYYTAVARWWASPIGRTIVLKDLALILVLLPSVLSMFFTFNRLTSYVAAWVDVGSFALVPVIMVWRTMVWRRLHRLGRLPRNGHDGLIPGPGEARSRDLLLPWPGRDAREAGQRQRAWRVSPLTSAARRPQWRSQTFPPWPSTRRSRSRLVIR